MKRDVTYNISVDFTPWMNNGYVLRQIHLFEELGGEIARGNAELEYVGQDDAFNLLLNQYTGKLTITKESVSILEIDIFIVKRRFAKNFLTIEFLCISDIKFITDLVSLEYTDIKDAIESSYPGNVDIRCETELNTGDSPIIQFKETNHSFCNKLAYSYKKDIIFGYSWKGLIIKDRIGEKNSRGDIEVADDTCIALIGGGGLEPLDPYSIKYNNLLYKKSWDPWTEVEDKEDEESSYTTLVPINSRTIKFHNNYLTLGTNFYPLVENYLYNQARIKDNMYAALRIEIKDIPNYELGDVVHYKYLSEANDSINIPYEYFLIKTNELFISVGDFDGNKNKSKIFWISTLVSLVDHNGELLPEKDPMVEISSEGKI